MKPQVGDIWEPEYGTRYGPVEILSEENTRYEGCYSVKFVTGEGTIFPVFQVIGGAIPFKYSKSANLENK